MSTLRFCWYKETNGALQTVDLLTGTLKLQANAWTTRTPQMSTTYEYSKFGATPKISHYEPVIETFPLTGEDTVANLVAALNDIEEGIENNRDYFDNPLSGTFAFLEWYVTGENSSSGSKRSLIYEASIRYQTDIGYSPMMEGQRIKAVLVVTRHPFWENYTGGIIGAQTISALGGTMKWGDGQTYSAVPGIVPARIYKTSLRAVAATNTITRLWLGVRPEYEGVDDFDPLLQLEDGTQQACCSIVDDSDATPETGISSADNCVRVGFASGSGYNTMQERCSLTIGQVCSAAGHTNYNDYIGRYLVLCRCKVTSGATIRLQMRHGYTSTTSLAQSGSAYITNTGFMLIELGHVQIPAHGYWSGQSLSVARGFEIEIWAEHLAGTDATDYLYLDSLVLIPSDHAAFVDGAYLDTSYENLVEIFVQEHDGATAIAYKNEYPDINTEFAPREWVLPKGGGVLVIAGQGSSAQTFTDTIYTALSYTPRWLSYRGDSD